MSDPGTNFVQSLAAVLAGNAAYFLLMPYLPQAARHVPFQTDMGFLAGRRFCLAFLGVIRAVLAERASSR